MSAAVCRKRAFIDDTSPSASPALNKKHRYSYGGLSGSPPAPEISISTLVDQLRVNFPTMSIQIIETALQDCGYDIESTITRLGQLRLSYTDGNLASVVEDHAGVINGNMPTGEQSVPLENTSPLENLPVNGADWVELLVREMMGAATVDDAKSRAARVLEGLEKSINANAGAEAAENFQKLKEKNDVLLQENACLKRAVVVFAERQKDYDCKKQELEQLKHLLDEYKGQLSSLEVKNYGLTMYLQQAQQSNSMHGRFPDVF